MKHLETVTSILHKLQFLNNMTFAEYLVSTWLGLGRKSTWLGCLLVHKLQWKCLFPVNKPGDEPTYYNVLPLKHAESSTGAGLGLFISVLTLLLFAPSADTLNCIRLHWYLVYAMTI